MRRSRAVPSLPRAALACAAVVLPLACGAAPEREPTPEFLAVRPQSIAVAEPYGGGGELELRVAAELQRQLSKLGYQLAAPGAAADAELRYHVERSDASRSWYDGRRSATVEVSAELRSPHGILWQDAASGRGSDDEEGEDRDDAFDVVFGMAMDSLEDSLFEPDDSDEFGEAVHDAVHALLRSRPKRLPAQAAPARP